MVAKIRKKWIEERQGDEVLLREGSGAVNAILLEDDDERRYNKRKRGTGEGVVGSRRNDKEAGKRRKGEKW